jgi:hypothetical protein
MRLFGMSLSKDPDAYRGGGRWVGDDQPRWVRRLDATPARSTPARFTVGAWVAGALVGFGFELLTGLDTKPLWLIPAFAAQISVDLWWQQTRAPHLPPPASRAPRPASRWPSKDPEDYR